MPGRPRPTQRLYSAQTSITPVVGCSRKWRCQAIGDGGDTAGSESDRAKSWVKQQLDQLNAEVAIVAAKLNKVEEALLACPDKPVLQQVYDRLRNEKARLDERRKALEAMLSGNMAAEAPEPLTEAFWVKLRELRANASSLDTAEYMGRKFQVINLGGELQFPGEGCVTRVLRRDCYQVAHDALKAIWDAPGPKVPVIISGTPGTGKTVFLYDVMFEYALNDHAILWHSWDSPGTLICFGPDGVRQGSWKAFKQELLDPEAIYLCDSVAPFKVAAVVRPKTIIAVSPNRLKMAYLNDLVKTCEQLWFPVPSDEEMYAAAPLYGVDEAMCKNLMYRWGNVPRYVLQFARNAQQQKLLDEAIKNVSAKVIDDAVRDYQGADRLTTKLVHVQATPDLARNGVGLGSVWIQIQLNKRLKMYEGDAARRLVEFCTGLGAGLAAGAGGVHQWVMHSAFMRGGWFLLRDFNDQQSVIWLPPLQIYAVNSSQDVADLASWWESSSVNRRPAGMYAVPTNPSFPAVDSAIIVDINELAKPPTPASSTSGNSFNSAWSTTITSTQSSATEPSEATHTGTDTASSAALAAEASQATTVMDEPAAAEAVSSPAAAASVVLGVQITTNRNHKINYAGWQSFSSATGSNALAFAVPLHTWSEYPLQKFEGGPANAAQQVRCDQYVITCVPATEDELGHLTLKGLEELGKAYGITDASKLAKAQLIKQLLEVKVPTADFSVLEAALQKVCIPPQPEAAATATKPEPAADVADSGASGLCAAGLHIAAGQVQQAISPAQRFSKADVRGWSAKWLKETCKKYDVPMKGGEDKALLMERFMSQHGIDR